ncbi:unnamed protein product [Arctogadus glacialis]
MLEGSSKDTHHVSAEVHAVVEAADVQCGVVGQLTETERGEVRNVPVHQQHHHSHTFRHWLHPLLFLARGPFQQGNFYCGPNQALHSMGDVPTQFMNHIEGPCLSFRGEEPVWRPY